MFYAQPVVRSRASFENDNVGREARMRKRPCRASERAAQRETRLVERPQFLPTPHASIIYRALPKREKLGTKLHHRHSERQSPEQSRDT